MEPASKDPAKPTPEEIEKERGYSISHLPADVQERIPNRSVIARKAKEKSAQTPPKD